MSASKYGQGNLSQLGPNQLPVQTVGTTPVVFLLYAEDFDVVTLQLIIESGTISSGTWTIDGSNDYADIGQAGTAPKNGGAEHWTPVIPAAFPAVFSPALVAVVANYPAASGNQGITGFKFGWRTLRITFTPITGAGLISVYAFAKASN
jgi:hypothetical protein